MTSSDPGYMLHGIGGVLPGRRVSRRGFFVKQRQSARKRVMIVAGEASGDLHGARLVRELRARASGIDFWGIGGKALRSEGVRLAVDCNTLAVVGITEVLPRLPQILAGMNTAKNLLRDVCPDLLILIDFPDFNLHLAATAKRIGVPVLYYITPQVWAWRKGRVRILKRRIDHAAVILPFEADFFRRHGIAATYVGHPLLDHEPPKNTPTGRLWPETGAGGPLVALLPGSREREVAGHLPAMVEAADRLARRHPELRFAVSVAPSVRRETVEEILIHRSSLTPAALTVTEAPVEALFSACTMAVAVSGTVTLQAALAGTPTVIVYRVSALSYWAGRTLIRVPFIGLANLIAGRQVMPELIQKEANADRIARAVEQIVFSPETLERMRRELSRIRLRMGRPGASARVADIAMNLLGAPRR